MKCAPARGCGSVRGETPQARYSDFRLLPRNGVVSGPRAPPPSPSPSIESRIGFAPANAGLGFVAGYRSATVADSHGLPCTFGAVVNPPASKDRRAINEPVRLASPDAATQDLRARRLKKRFGIRVKLANFRRRVSETSQRAPSSERKERTELRKYQDLPSLGRSILTMAGLCLAFPPPPPSGLCVLCDNSGLNLETSYQRIRIRRYVFD
jgi:hypothetical protein